MQKIIAIGLMSGTSLDGVDIAACEFFYVKGNWNFNILKADTIPYTEEWKERLGHLHNTGAATFWKTHVDYGHYLGLQVRDFLDSSEMQAEIICSHGHTILHRPDLGYTMQAGAGEAISAETGLPVVSDFRVLDVALGGQGAPLVPLGDRMLFNQYGACLNLGGFSNISFEINDHRIAFDICPCNIVLNRLANLSGQSHDEDGLMARQGKILEDLLEQLNALEYYELPPPKSLGREWLEEIFWPVLNVRNSKNSDLLKTSCEHIGFQIGKTLEDHKINTVLITGGGVHNSYLLETIQKKGSFEVIVPDSLLVDYKEALIFAFLGVLRWKGFKNVLSSVTGCKTDHSGGAVIYPFPDH